MNNKNTKTKQMVINEAINTKRSKQHKTQQRLQITKLHHNKQLQNKQ